MTKRKKNLISTTAGRYLTLLQAEEIEPIHPGDENLGKGQQNNEYAASLLSDVTTWVELGWLDEALLTLGRAEGILLGTGFLSPKQVLSLE